MRARRTGTVRATAVSFGALVLMAPALASSPSSAAEEREATTSSVAPSTQAVDDELLDGPARGRTAITELGDQIGLAAARNDLGARSLESLLLEDRTLWLDSDARLYAIDPAPEPPPGRGTTDSSRGSPDAATPAPLADTFALHSNPDATRKVFVDVDGGTVSGTWWNSESGVATTHPAWDPAGNGPSFTDDELAQVQKIWAIIAEDYAPWQVDVTTADPGVAGLTRSDAADPTYGTRALVTPSVDAWSRICQSQCGGVAYVGTYGDTGSPTPTQPAWVFPQALGDDAKAIAEAVTHEVGHNLALTHDGNATQDYDPGHGAWAPIMGTGFDRPITQWSQGSYVGANNQQDDLAVITGFLARRPDEAGATAATAAALPAAGVASSITDRSDVDAFTLGACGAGATATIAPAATSPNLDVRAGVLDDADAVVASADPASAYVDRESASGLGATVPVPAGSTSTLLVDGTGNGGWSTGYDDYASLGAYTVAVSGCTADATVPSAPTDVVATAGAADPTITLTWAPPTSVGSGAVTGYRVSRLDTGESTLLGAQARSFVLGGLAPGTRYDLSVAALNAAGSGPVATAGATTYAPRTPPGAPREPTAVWNADPDRVLLRWAAPADDGGDAVTTYAIGVDGVNRGSVSAADVAVTIDGPFSIGAHTVTVRAANAVGSGPPASVTFDVAAPPANDDVDAARVLTGAAGTTTATTYGATGAVDDPVPPGTDLGAGRHSVWFAWTAPSRRAGALHHRRHVGRRRRGPARHHAGGVHRLPWGPDPGRVERRHQRHEPVLARRPHPRRRGPLRPRRRQLLPPRERRPLHADLVPRRSRPSPSGRGHGRPRRRLGARDLDGRRPRHATGDPVARHGRPRRPSGRGRRLRDEGHGRPAGQRHVVPLQRPGHQPRRHLPRFDPVGGRHARRGPAGHGPSPGPGARPHDDGDLVPRLVERRPGDRLPHPGLRRAQPHRTRLGDPTGRTPVASGPLRGPCPGDERRRHVAGQCSAAHRGPPVIPRCPGLPGVDAAPPDVAVGATRP